VFFSLSFFLSSSIFISLFPCPILISLLCYICFVSFFPSTFLSVTLSVFLPSHLYLLLLPLTCSAFSFARSVRTEVSSADLQQTGN
jgi:hypothetical protein